MPTAVFCTTASGRSIEHFRVEDADIEICKTKLFNYWLKEGKPTGFGRLVTDEGIVSSRCMSVAEAWSDIKKRKKKVKGRGKRY